MADNLTLNAGTGGSALATKEVTHSGDTAHIQHVTLAGVDGTEGSYTITNMTFAEDTAHSSADHGIMPLAVRRDADTTLSGTDGDYTPLQVDANGYLKVEIFDGGGSHTIDGTVTANLSATDNAVLDNIQTAVEIIDNAISGSEMQVDIVSGTVTANLSATDNAVLDTIDAVLDTIKVDTEAIETAVEIIDNAIFVDDAAFTLGTSSGVMIMGFAGTQSVDANDAGAIAIETDGAVHIHDGGNSITIDGTVTANLSATDNAVLDNIQTAVEIIDNIVSGSEAQVDVVAALPAGTNLIGNVGLGVRTSGGTSTYYDSDLDEAAIAVKASAGNIYSIQAFNTTAAPLFLQLFNVAQGSVTVGTTTPTNQYVIPGNADSDGAGVVINLPVPKSYGTAITAACSTDSEGNGAPGAGACIVNIEYA